MEDQQDDYYGEDTIPLIKHSSYDCYDEWDRPEINEVKDI